MQIVPFTDSLGLTEHAVLISFTASEDDELMSLAALLMDRHECSSKVIEGPSTRRIAHLFFKEMPKGWDPDTADGKYALSAWVKRKLNPIMPDGWYVEIPTAMLAAFTAHLDGNYQFKGLGKAHNTGPNVVWCLTVSAQPLSAGLPAQ